MRTRAMAMVLGTWTLALAAACGGGGLEGVTEERAALSICPTPPPSSPNITLPADDAPHGAPTEWWYYNGHLLTVGGQRFGFQVTFFVFQVAPGVFLRIGELGITDDNTGVYHQLGTPPEPGAYAATTNRFDLSLAEGWSARGGDGHDDLAASTTDGYAISLHLESLKNPVYRFDNGKINYPGGETQFYYTRERMAAVGSVTVNGRAAFAVGEADFEHEWGLFPFIGSDYLFAQLDNGEEISGYVIRTFHTETVLVKAGSFTPLNCNETPLAANDFSMSASGGNFTSPVSGFTYALNWDLVVPSKALTLHFTPTVQDQEMHWPNPFFMPFYEGEAKVTGTQHGFPVRGRGYIELTGR